MGKQEVKRTGLLLSLVSSPNGKKVQLCTNFVNNEDKITVIYHTGSTWLNNNLWEVTKSATNFNACLCLDRSAISSHSAMGSLTDHYKKRLC